MVIWDIILGVATMSVLEREELLLLDFEIEFSFRLCGKEA